MADSPLLITHSNECARVISDSVCNLRENITRALQRWSSGVSAVCPSGETVDDGRATEGIFQLTTDEYITLMGNFQAILTQLDTAFFMDVMNKARVRSLRS